MKTGKTAGGRVVRADWLSRHRLLLLLNNAVNNVQ